MNRARVVRGWGLWGWTGVFVAATAGCASSPATLADEPQAQSTEVANPVETETWEEAPVQLLDARIDGDTLRVVAAYGGGCGFHQFALEPSGPMLKSLPPKQPLRVVHRSTGDPCRAWIHDSLALDLTPFRGTPRGVTLLLLESVEGPLTYRYP